MKWIKLIALAATLFFLYRFCERETDGFRISRISHTASAVVDVAPEISQILNQKFHYLGSGGQFWVFVSDDDRYVLKFFKTKKATKRQRDLESCKLAFNSFKEETGLLYLHLNKSECNLKTLLEDKLHIEHCLLLDDKEFILQKKALLAYEHLSKLMKEGKIDEAKEAISQICQLIIKRCKKGIFDEDPRLHCNCGFIDNKAILIDFGRLKADPKRASPEIYQKDLRKVTAKFKRWLEVHYPELVSYLEAECDY